MLLRPGSQVGPYVVAREIARGGQGAVLEARDPEGRVVALKLLLDDDEEAGARFLREAETLSRLDHPNLIKVLDCGQTPGGVAYLALEFVHGQSLSEWVRSGGPPPLDEALRVMGDAAEALDYCHEQGLVHRDLKPQNILLEAKTGRVVIVDFGLVRRSKLALAWNTQDRASLTQEGAVLGTPAYMPPEQISPEFGVVDRRSDVYGLGATLFFLLTGQAPFTAPGGVLQLLTRVASDPAPDPRALRPDLPPHLGELCLRSLAKEAAARPSTALEFGAALLGPRRTSSPLAVWALALTGLVLTGLATGAALLALGSGQATPTPSAAVATPNPSAAASLAPSSPSGPVLEETLARAKRLLAAEDAGQQRAGEKLLRQLSEQGNAEACFALGLRRLDQERPREAHSLLLRAAEGGSSGAMLNVALLYEKGEGVPRDLSQARVWYLRGAKAGLPQAMLHLGFQLVNGKGGPRDEARARQWLERAASRGEVKAMLLLGQLAKRKGDDPAAAEWLERAAEAGNAQAMSLLAYHYEAGLGVPQSWERAAELYRGAAELGESRAYFPWAELLLHGRGVEENPAEAFRWFSKVSKGRDLAAAKGRVGTLLLRRTPGVPHDPERGVRLLREAVKEEDPESMLTLAGCFLEGVGVEKDPVEGAAWLEAAARKEHPSAMHAYGMALLTGTQIPGDRTRGLEWLERAAEAGLSRSAEVLGAELMRDSRFAEAVPWLERAAKAGDPASMVVLANCYQAGRGVPRNLQRARALLRQAAGSPPSKAREAARKALEKLERRLEKGPAQERRRRRN